MSATSNTTNDRVGMYLKTHTRDRLNKFIADYRLATGTFLNQSKAIDMLLDHYQSTAPKLSNQRELAR